MTSRIYLALIVFISILLLGCENDVPRKLYYQETNSIVFSDQFHLVEYGEISFPLDQYTGFESNSICYFEDENGKGKLSILNYINKAVYVYDYENKTRQKKIKIAQEGPDGVGKIGFTSGHFMNHMDSLYILNYRKSKLYLINSGGEVKRVYNLKDPKEDAAPHPYIKTITPVVHVEGKLFISCSIPFVQIEDFDQFFTTVVIDKTTGSVKKYFPLPQLYSQGYWGYNSFKYEPTFVYNSFLEEFLVSFPIDPFIYKYSKHGILEEKHYISSMFFKEINPISLDAELRYKEPDYDRDKKYALTEPNFGYLVYDRGAKKYLRHACIWPSEMEYEQGNTTPESSYIIFDEDFVKVGETRLDKDYAFHMYFINGKGLHIAKRSRYLENEDLLTFAIFKIDKKNDDEEISFSDSYRDRSD